MFGGNKELGLVQFTIETIFAFIEAAPEKEFLVRVSFFEIFNESINDLSSEKTNLDLIRTENGNIIINDLNEIICNSAYDAIELLNKEGSLKPERRSCSELIYRIVIESRQRSGGHTALTTINLIKLSDSDYLLEETNKSSHKSLDGLNEVMQRTTRTNARKTIGPIPYSESKLTEYLQKSLEGSGRIAFICTMSAAYTSYDKTMSTFCFAMRARGVNLLPNRNFTEKESESLLIQRTSEDYKNTDPNKPIGILISGEITFNDSETNKPLLSSELTEDITSKMEEKINISIGIQKRVKQFYEGDKVTKREPLIEYENLLSMNEENIIDPLEGKDVPIDETKAKELREILLISEKNYSDELSLE